MKYIIAVLATLTMSFTAYAGPCSTMVPFGTPKVTTKEPIKLLCRRMYAVAHSPSRKTAYWSAEHLIGQQQLADAKRIDAFKTDPDLPIIDAARPSDYNEPDYDQGHLAPVGDMQIDPTAMLESFYMSNMVPQAPGNNRVGWNHLEYFVRGASMKYHDVYVITGPVYQCNPCKTIGKNKVWVPTHLYKVVLDRKSMTAISFMVPNIPFNGKEIPNYITNIATIQKAVGIKFFPTSKVKITESTQLWDITLG